MEDGAIMLQFDPVHVCACAGAGWRLDQITHYEKN